MKKKLITLITVPVMLLAFLTGCAEENRIYEDRHMIMEISDKYEDKRIRSVKPTIMYDINYYLVFDNDEKIQVSYIVYNKYDIGDDLFVNVTDVYNKNEDGTKTYVKSTYKLEN